MHKSPWKKDFPLLKKQRKLAYLDSAATTHKPKAVISAIDNFYTRQNSNIHRGVYTLSQEATDAYETSRKVVAQFINSNSEKEIIFTKGATESVNLVANTFGKMYLEKDDLIVITELEHHANIIPWQQIAKEKECKIEYVKLLEDGTLDQAHYKELLEKEPKIVAFSHTSNSLGTINPVKEMTKAAKRVGARVLIDGCQAIQHQKIDVQAIGCDFYVFSGHKIYAPTGIGVLWAKYDLLEEMPPYQTGGDMIMQVTKETTTFVQPPTKFEAGTPPIAQAIGLAAAIQYLKKDFEKKTTHEQNLLQYATQKLELMSEVTIIGKAHQKAPIISFTVDGIHPHDIGTILDEHGVAARTGQHCTQLAMEAFSIPATTRVSFSFYNDKKDIDKLVSGLNKAIALFR